MNYEPTDDHDMAGVADRKLLSNIASLLSVKPEELQKTLCSRVIAAGGQVVEKGLTVSDAMYARDAYAKVIFLQSIKSYNVYLIPHWQCALGSEKISVSAK